MNFPDKNNAHSSDPQLKSVLAMLAFTMTFLNSKMWALYSSFQLAQHIACTLSRYIGE